MIPSTLSVAARLSRHLIESHGYLVAARELGRRAFGVSLKSFGQVAPFFRDRSCLEIGGPSRHFRRGHVFPIYGIAGRIDNCDYSTHTIWQQRSRDDLYRYDPKSPPGRLFICEGTDLRAIPDGQYDCILSCHVLEHFANPLQALLEMKRVVKTPGYLLHILPHRDGAFDHRRPITTLAHLQSDLASGKGEDDLSHMPEILELHDYARDWLTPKPEFIRRAPANAAYRSLHHHVFDTDLTIRALHETGLEIVMVDHLLPADIIVLSKKISGPPDNCRWLDRSWRDSPFPSDRGTSKRDMPEPPL